MTLWIDCANFMSGYLAALSPDADGVTFSLVVAAASVVVDGDVSSMSILESVS